MQLQLQSWINQTNPNLPYEILLNQYLYSQIQITLLLILLSQRISCATMGKIFLLITMQILLTVFVINIMYDPSTTFTFWSCLLIFAIFIFCLVSYKSKADASRIRDFIDVIYDRHEYEIESQFVTARREHYRQDSHITIPFCTRTHIATWAMRALPPVKSFNGSTDQTINCPICMEEFSHGELIQPFGLCSHEFHSLCLNSWIFSGKTTCPICREDLTTIRSTPRRVAENYGQIQLRIS